MHPTITGFDAILTNMAGGFQVFGFVHVLADSHTSA
jgi:hypothetical protein